MCYWNRKCCAKLRFGRLLGSWERWTVFFFFMIWPQFGGRTRWCSSFDGWARALAKLAVTNEFSSFALARRITNTSACYQMVPWIVNPHSGHLALPNADPMGYGNMCSLTQILSTQAFCQVLNQHSSHYFNQKSYIITGWQFQFSRTALISQPSSPPGLNIFMFINCKRHTLSMLSSHWGFKFNKNILQDTFLIVISEIKTFKITILIQFHSNVFLRDWLGISAHGFE